VKRLQKFRKAATFKIQDLPEDSAKILDISSQILGIHDMSTAETNGTSVVVGFETNPQGKGEMARWAGAKGSGAKGTTTGSGRKESVNKLMNLLMGLPDMTMDELRGLADLLRRVLAGADWDKIKQLMAGMTSVGGEDLMSRIAYLEECIGVEHILLEKNSDGGAQEEKADEAKTPKKKDFTHKKLQDLRKDLNNLGEIVKNILEGGGPEAAQATFEEVKQIWNRIDKHGSDLERAFAHIEAIETKLRDFTTEQTNLFRLAQSLKDDKADKKWVRQEMDEKADRADLDLKVDQEQYQKDIEEIDAVVAELEAQISDAMVKFYRELNALKVSHNGKLDKENFANLSKMTMDKINHMEQMLTFVSEVFGGDKAGNFLKNRIIRNNCCSCDRTIYAASHAVEPSIPKADGMSAARSIAPVTALKMDQVRRAVNNNNGLANRNNNSASQFSRAVTHRESLWRERSERARHGRLASPEVVGRVRVKNLRDFSNEAYYRVTEPGGFVDTYAQDPRPIGGDYTQVRTEQKILKTAPLLLPPLEGDANNNNDGDVFQLEFQGGSGTLAAVPKLLIEKAVDLVSRTNPHQTFVGDATKTGSNQNEAQNLDAQAGNDGSRNPPTTPL